MYDEGVLEWTRLNRLLKEMEELLISQSRLSEVWLYKAAHHGSKYSNSMELLEVISPEVAVISCSKNNRYGHPSPDAISNMNAVGAEIYYTMDVGQVTICVDEANRIRMKEFLSE